MFMGYDLALNGGTVFDGSGAPGRVASVAVKDGVIAAIGDGPFEADRVIDARGQWVMPGFLDVHTHYDAEVEAAPALSESLVHGVTTIFMGSCSLGAVLSEPLDIADMYTRVEAMPREHVLPLFEKRKTWKTPREYREHLSTLKLGPNVACFMGHSDLRCAAMGLERSVTDGVVPTAQELARMRAWLSDGLDAGFLGLSCNTNRWDKLGGTRFRSKPLPSTYARWREIRALVDVVRERGRVLQGIPNISAKYDTFLFFFESAGWWLRKAVKTSLVGRSFHEIAAARGGDVVEVFLDLCAEHGNALRWRTVIGNDRPHAVKAILAHPDTSPGFSDAGAHLRNMAFYNFPLLMLRLAARDGFMPVERAVHRLTGEIASFYGLDAGRLEVGARADVAVVDPARLDDALDGIHEGSMPELGGHMRLVRRNPEAVPYVLVNGVVAAERGVVRDAGHGRFLAAGEVQRGAVRGSALAAA